MKNKKVTLQHNVYWELYWIGSQQYIPWNDDVIIRIASQSLRSVGIVYPPSRKDNVKTYWRLFLEEKYPRCFHIEDGLMRVMQRFQCYMLLKIDA